LQLNPASAESLIFSIVDSPAAFFQPSTLRDLRYGMYLAPDENETQIADAANRILADLTPLSRLHHGGSAELSPATRQAVAEGGWFALSLPEICGGAEMSEVEFALFFREAGRQCASVDLLAQSLAVLLVKDQPEIRDPLIGGERTVSLLVTDSDNVRLLGGSGDWALHVEPQSARLLNAVDSPVIHSVG